MTTVAFIGLGIMGGPMAANLVKAGFEVVGLQPQPGAGAAARRRRRARRDRTSPRPSSDADVIVTMVPDSPDVEAVTGGDDGVFAYATPGALYVDMSTIRPDVAVARGRGRARGRAPRTRRARSAAARPARSRAACRSWSAARPADFAAAKPVLDAVGKTIVHVGPAGSGQTVKAANQLIVAGNIELLAEAVVFLEALRRGHEGRAGGTRRRPGRQHRARTARAPNMLAREFTPGFRLALHHKDLGIVTSAAREAGVVIPLGSAVAQLVAALVARGDGGLDHSGLLKLVTELSGRA